MNFPVDIEQCQAKVPNGNMFMTFSVEPRIIRCKNKPTWIAVERKEQPNGRGAMAICDSCKNMCEAQAPSLASFQMIEEEL